MKKVWTSSGYTNGPVNSLVGKGESIIDYTNLTGTLVTKGLRGVDNLPSSVKEGDLTVIAGNDVDWSNGVKFSDQAAPLTAKLQMYNNIEKNSGKYKLLSSLSKLTQELLNKQLLQVKQPILGALKNITDRLQMQHQIEDYNNQTKKYDGGKSLFSSYFSSGPGKVSNSTIDSGYLIPAILEGKMLNHWMKEQPQMPNIYAANRYAQSALGLLNKMRVDPYNLLRLLDSQERAAYYRMLQNGGYSGGQRQNARVALALGNAKQASDILNATQLLNNQYRSQWANAALQEGNQDAARRQSAAQYGWEAYSRAHGAKTKGIETHLANLGALGLKWLQQRIKNKQYGDILNMYQLDIDNKNAALGALYGRNKTAIPVVNNNAPLQQVTPLAKNGNYDILNRYYRNTPLGDVFSISNPYLISYPDIALQRVPKGKFYMMPDLMPPKNYNSDLINGAIQDAINTRRWATNKLDLNEINMGTIGDGNIIRDYRLYFNEPNNKMWILNNLFNRKAQVNYIPSSGYEYK